MHTLGTVNTCSLGSSTGLKANQFDPSFSPVTKQMLGVTHRLAKVKNLLLPRPSGFTRVGANPVQDAERKE